ncbi:Polyketide cyclase / dehydrase and lipid transport [Corynebacterium massiliense DSM 45435]|uniref:Polyketide cyclase / dehydrase and lipid transport n=2 Tax=Corynebacterium massiliense TaxID=441501 RepID=A0ABY7U4Y8_9CORY|nr:Polyketide cyclase / dehydrase and lipid transport [Corynebacterium massiliense DSM 45435]
MGAMTETTTTATRTIDAAANDIFDILSNPDRHQETDGSGMVRSADKGERLQKVGDTFTMNMHNDDGDYQTVNEVYAFEEGRVIGWKNVRNITTDVEVGAKWLYELSPEDEGHTKVTLTYDRSDIESDKVRALSENFDEKFLENSLSDLAEALA